MQCVFSFTFAFCWLTAVQCFQVANRPFVRGFSLHHNDIEGEQIENESPSAKKVCIIGSGWAGFSAADALSSCKIPDADNRQSQPLEIHLLDASPRGPGGLAGGWTSKRLNRTVEAGLHGFWREYRNTYATIERIGLDIDEVLTNFTPSVLVSQSGRVALAPVLGEGNRDNLKDSDMFGLHPLLPTLAELLPPPLDIALLSEFDSRNPLSAVDRMSALGLLGVWSDFDQEDPNSWEKYDGISADSLFRSIGGVSNNLYKQLVSPLLHVLPMTPGWDCSAAAALSCFHTFALQSRGAFDVRWCKGTISERIFNPWAEKLLSTGVVHIEGGSRVTSIEEIGLGGNRIFKVEINEEKSQEFDYVIFAVGAHSFKSRLLPCSSFLSKHTNAEKWKKLRGITCVAIRIFLKPKISGNRAFSVIKAIDDAMEDSPVFVCGANIGGIPELVESGFCIYDLQRLQEEYSLAYQQNEEPSPCVAYEVDFFRADALAKMNDADVTNVALKAFCAALEIPAIDEGSILDVSVVRAKDAVSHFCVDSASWSPQVKLQENVFICGDWIDRTGHGSWSTEKAVVTGRQAAAALARDIGLDCDADVLPVTQATPQLSALRQIAKTFQKAAPMQSLPRSPLAFLKQIGR